MKTKDFSNFAPKHILLFFHSAIGDIIIGGFIPKAIKEKFPDCKVTWVVYDMYSSLVKTNPYVDDIIIFPINKSLKATLKSKRLSVIIREMLQLIKTLRAKRGSYDLAIDIHGHFKSVFMAKVAGVKLIIGKKNNRECANIWENHLIEIDLYKLKTLNEANLAFLAPLGISIPDPNPMVFVMQENIDEANKFLAENNLHGRNFVAFTYASSSLHKDLPIETWGELSFKIYEKYGLKSVIFGGPKRMEEGEGISQKYPHIISAVGKFSMLSSIATIQKATFVVGTDTGMSYSAFHTDTPLVVIYGCYMVGVSEQKDMEYIMHYCPMRHVKKMPKCKGTHDCLTSVTVDEIMGKIEKQEPRFIEKLKANV